MPESETTPPTCTCPDEHWEVGEASHALGCPRTPADRRETPPAGWGDDARPAWVADLDQSGHATPGCDCGHDGMGAAWHAHDCAWKAGVAGPATAAPAEPVPGLRDQIDRIVRRVPGNGADEYGITDAVMAVVQPVIDDLTASRADWKALADQAKAGWDEAQQRAEAMERAMEDTAADALKHRGCHRSLMGQVQRAETAEAALDKVRGIDPDKLDLLADWFDTDDARKGPGRDFAVQADLRQWARTLRALTPPVPAGQPEGGVG